MLPTRSGRCPATIAHQHERPAEAGQAQPRMRPAAAEEHQGDERADRGGADALQRERQAGLPDTADDAPEGRPLAGVDGNGRDRQHHQQREQRHDRAGRHGAREPGLLEQGHADRAAERERAVQGHADQREHQAGALRPRHAEAPRHQPDHGHAFAQPEQQPAGEEHAVGGRRRQARPARGAAHQRRRRHRSSSPRTMQ